MSSTSRVSLAVAAALALAVPVSAQQSAPAEKIAPSLKSGQSNVETQKAPETTGQAPSASDAGKTGATDKGAMDKGAMDKPAAKSSGGDADIKAKSETSPAGTAPKSSQSTTEQSGPTTGQGAAAGAAKLSTEQRSKITTVIKQQKVAPVKLSVSVSVGTRLPASVRFHTLPVEVVTIYPEWRGYVYILVDDEIVVVDPNTHMIVAILEA